MQKTAHVHCAAWWRQRWLAQTLLVMRLTIILLTAAFLQVHATGVSQTVTLSGRNIPLQKVFAEIKQQTGFIVFGNATINEHARPVTIDVRDMPLEAFLSLIAKQQDFGYEIIDKTIILSEKKAARITQQLGSAAASPPVTGIVRGPDGQPLAGVNVVVKGTKRGTTSDVNGKFTIDANENDVLVLSSIGYASKEFKLTADYNIIVDLERSTSPLDEVQIIAYGTTTQRFNTGNIASVKREDIEKQPVNNPLLALQGRVPGLFITQNTGVPGAGVTVRIQGRNSIGNGSDPLYVVDGVPYVSQMLPTTQGRAILSRSGAGPDAQAGAGNPLNYINVNDIESIEVLKDADATAIYGSRAANGAILITTKKGRSGPASFDVNMRYGWGKPSRSIEMMNTQQYLEMRREALKNDGITQPGASDYDINGTWDTTRYTDWQKELMSRTARYANLSATLSGGTSSVQYSVGSTYYRETPMFPGKFSDQKGGLHLNLNTVSQNRKFTFQFTGNYLTDNNQLPATNLTSIPLALPPNAPALYNEDGSVNWAPTASGTSTWTNPLKFLLETYTNKTNNLIANATIGYEILNNVDFKTSFGYNRLQTDEFATSPLTAVRPESRPFSQRSAMYSNSTSSSWIIEPQITYKKNFVTSRLEVLAGATLQQRDNKGENLSGIGYISDAAIGDIRAASDILVNATIASTYKYNALFGRINYAVHDRYIVNVTGRTDGSSRFGTANRFHNFGAVGAAWIFSEEQFFKGLSSVVSFGKIRGSFGTTGNDQINDYQYMDLYRPISYRAPYQGGTGLIADRLTNIYLQWEETKKLQGGIDLGLFKERINVTANFARNRSSNQLLGYVLPSITGFGTITVNLPATIQNITWEFSLTSKNITSKSFNWISNINLTVPKNKLVSFPGLETSTYADFIVVGQPLSAVKLNRFAGVDPATGVYQFWDNEGKLTFTPDPLKDRTVVLNTDPKFYGGLENSFRYKRFKIDILFQFIKQLNPAYSFGLTHTLFQPGRRNMNQPVEIFNRWKQPGDVVDIQRFSSNFDLYQSFNDALASDANFSDASIIRLRNLSLSYDVPGSWKGKIGMKSLALTAQGQNLLTITNYPGIDPEAADGALLKLFTFGLRAGF